MIISIFSILLFSIIFILFLSKNNTFLIRTTGLVSANLVLLISVLILIQFDFNNYYFQFIESFKITNEFLNFYFVFGLDGISIFFFTLSNFLIILCLLFVWKEELLKEYVLTLLILDLFLLIVFSVLDIFLFYIFFEAILIPMYLMIGIWGSRERKIRAVYLFFFYTLVGSLCMLLGIIYMYNKFGTLNLEIILASETPLSFVEQYWLWLAFFLSFASKIPMFPFHVWLPEAHVEAPTVGSVLLAGILLKLGVYGFIRFNLNLYPLASLYFSPFVYTLSTMGIIYASMTAIRQTDLKRIIAYSSIAHMNLVVLGIFSFNMSGIDGSILQSLSHGFVSGALFFLVGILYNRYHSRLLYYYGGLVHMMPIYSAYFLFFTLSNIAFPGTSSFIGEFLLLNGIYKTNTVCCVIAAIGVILSGAYSLWVYNRIVFGNLKIINTQLFADLTFKEFSILFPLFILVLLIGIYPNFCLAYLQMSSLNLYLLTVL